jgi:hypothetical protein
MIEKITEIINRNTRSVRSTRSSWSYRGNRIYRSQGIQGPPGITQLNTTNVYFAGGNQIDTGNTPTLQQHL